MRRRELAVDEPSPATTPCSTRCARAALEASRSRLNMDSPKKTRPAHPVQPSDQFSFQPHLDAVGVARCGVRSRRRHFRRDPGAGGILPGRGAGVDHRREIAIEGDLKAAISQGFRRLREQWNSAGNRIRADPATTTAPVARLNTRERCRADRPRAAAPAKDRRRQPAGPGSSRACSTVESTRGCVRGEPGDGLVHVGFRRASRRASR